MSAPGPARGSSPAGVWAPLAVAALVVWLDVLEGPKTQYVGVLTAVPLFAAALAGPAATAGVGLLTGVLAFALGLVQEDQAGAGVAAGPHRSCSAWASSRRPRCWPWPSPRTGCAGSAARATSPSSPRRPSRR